jgi:SAM-dependent methyltransferase
MRPTFWMIRRVKRTVWSRMGVLRDNVGAWRRFWRSYTRYRAMAPEQISSMHLYPCLGDDTAETAIEPIYFYQDAWAFGRIVEAHPESHVDVGSHHKFVALLSKVVPVTMVDLRPLSLPLDTLHFQKGSILDLPFADASLGSLSSLCVVEHIGLGRYGDPLDPHGSEKALAELKRVVRPGGDLYISVPLDDDNRIYFNAHRAFDEEYLLSLIAPFEVLERRYIYRGEFGEHRKSGFGVGCYHIRRPS